MTNGSAAHDLRGKVAVITGGTQGLGEATARLFAARGAAGLVICGRKVEQGEAVARDLSAGGCRTLFVRADLGDESGPAAVVDAVDKTFGRVDALVNAAAITDRGTILDTSLELFNRMFAVNVRAPFFLIQGCVKIMRREKIAGTVVNVLSMSSWGGQPFICAYSGSKGALAILTKNIAYSLLPDRIRVNGLNIGWMATPGEDAIQRRYHGGDPGWLAKGSAARPFGRLLQPEEVARAIAFLSCEESGLMTGSLVDFDQTVNGAYDSPAVRLEPLPDVGGW
jgi:NAD(P)-dependent dehydrogenase (short-subunit alcohol dehydrogenase family)